MAVIFAEILISLFAVFGLYAAVRLFCIHRFAPQEVAVALVIDHPVAKESAEWLLYRARESSGFVFAPRRIVVMIDATLENAAELMDTFTALGAACCFTKD